MAIICDEKNNNIINNVRVQNKWLTNIFRTCASGDFHFIATKQQQRNIQIIVKSTKNHMC